MDEQKTGEAPQEITADSSASSELPGKEISENELKEENKDEGFDVSQLLPDRMDEIAMIQVYSLQHWAHVYMGLLPHPKQKKTVSDFKEARIAVDCASALAEALMPHTSPEAQKELKILISDLKMNFISKSSNS